MCEKTEEINIFEKYKYIDDTNYFLNKNNNKLSSFFVNNPVKIKEPTKELKEPIKEKNIKKKQVIPKYIKKLVWNTYIGGDIIKHRCLCCKKSIIENTFFECGHIISEKDEGTLEISNLRPICSECNKSMGSMNMIDYIKKYGLYI